MAKTLETLRAETAEAERKAKLATSPILRAMADVDADRKGMSIVAKNPDGTDTVEEYRGVDTSKLSLKRLKLETVESIGEMNPRKRLDRLDGLKTDLLLNGQITPIRVATLTGEALKYAQRTNERPDYTEETHFAFQGNRRLAAIRAIHSELTAEKLDASKFETILAIVGKPISSKAELIVLINDDAAKEGLTTRTEVARSIAALREAGRTLESIAHTFHAPNGKPRSIAWVQDMERISQLPPEVRAMIEKSDIENADAANKVKELPADHIEFPNSLIRTLNDSFRDSIGTLPENKNRTKNVKPRPFAELMAEVREFKGPKPEPKGAEVAPIDDARILAIRQDIGSNFRPELRDVCLAVLDSLRAADLSALKTYHAK